MPEGTVSHSLPTGMWKTRGKLKELENSVLMKKRVRMYSTQSTALGLITVLQAA